MWNRTAQNSKAFTATSISSFFEETNAWYLFVTVSSYALHVVVGVTIVDDFSEALADVTKEGGP